MNGSSFWHLIAPPVPHRARLQSVIDAEFAIVGAGIAGLSLALSLARAGREVALVEAATPGSGALGASAGIVAPQLVRTTPRHVLTRLGSTPGANWLRLIGESGGYLFDLIRTLDIACDARPFGFIAPAKGPRAERRLQEIVAQWRPFRQDLAVLSGGEVAAFTGAFGYSAAIVDASGGGVDPLRLAHGLAERAAQAGAQLHDHSPAVGISGHAGHWKVRTTEGEVRARTVALCANGGNHRLHPGLRESVLPMRVHELVTDPLCALMLDSTLPAGHALTDLENDIFSIRVIEGDRLLTYYPVSAHASMQSVEAAVNDRLRAMLTHFQPVRIAHWWEGVAWMNSSLMPRVVVLDDGLFAIQACNGRGIATNAIVGREVARAFLDREGYRPGIAFEKPRAIGGFALARHLPNVLLRGARVLGRLKSGFG